MKYILATPHTTGDMTKPIVINEMELVMCGLNFQPGLNGKATINVVFEDQGSGWQHHVSYCDEDAMNFINEVFHKAVSRKLIKKLIEDGKLPPGKIV